MEKGEIKNRIEVLTQKSKSLKEELDSVLLERNKLIISNFDSEVRKLLEAHNSTEVCLEKLYKFELPDGCNVQLDFYENYRNNRFDLYRLAVIDGDLKFRCILYGQDSNYYETVYFCYGEDDEWHDLMELVDPNEYTIDPEWFDQILYGLTHNEDIWKNIDDKTLKPVFDAKISKWGYEDGNGRWFIKPYFDDSGYFQEGFACVRLNGKYGFIKTNGDYLIEPIFDDAYNFEEGFACVCLNGKYGFIKTDGDYLVEPIFDDAYNFEDGFARVCLNGEWKYLDSNGNIKSDNNG